MKLPNLFRRMLLAPRMRAMLELRANADRSIAQHMLTRYKDCQVEMIEVERPEELEPISLTDAVDAARTR